MNIHLESTQLVNCYNRQNVDFARGDGAYLFSRNGSRYLDFLSGISVTNFGHSHPGILEAVREQAEKFLHVSNIFSGAFQQPLAEKLSQVSGLNSVFFCNSGTEANEAAIKFARKWADSESIVPGEARNEIITALGGFHGRTLGSLSATGQYNLREGFLPLLPGFSFVPYDDIEAVEYSITGNTIGIMVEPIQGESGIIIPSRGYLKKLRKLCDENNLLLIIDEVQTGMGRTGKVFACQWEDVVPDIITTAKGIANGLPLGAVICSSKVARCITPGCHGSTFGGNPVAVAAADRVIRLLTDEMLGHINRMGELLLSELRNIRSDLIKDTRGRGLMIGIELGENTNAKDIASGLLEEKVIAGISGRKIIRLLPPFIITEKEVEHFVNVFKHVLNI